MNDSPHSTNLLIGILATLLVVLVIGTLAVLAAQPNLLYRPAAVQATAPPVLVTRVVPGSDTSVHTYPTLPPAWTDTPVPTATATAPTATPSATETATITPTIPSTDTPAPTATGPTPTRRPTVTSSATSRFTPRPTSTPDAG